MSKRLASMAFAVYVLAVKSLLKSLVIFLLLIVATSVAFDVFKVEFGKVDFWQVHGVMFLICISFFPRLTLLFSSVAFGGFFWWLGLIIFPRILVAVLATQAYFHTNPGLVVISWFVALSGETAEKLGLGRNRSKFVFRTFKTGAGPAPFDYAEPQSQQSTLHDKGDAIEAEFKKY